MTTNENAPDFLSFTMEYLSKRPNCKILILLEGPNGGFETLQNDPSFVWAFGMVRTADQIIGERLAEVRNREIERALRDKTEREANGLDVSKGKSN